MDVIALMLVSMFGARRSLASLAARLASLAEWLGLASLAARLPGDGGVMEEAKPLCRWLSVAGAKACDISYGAPCCTSRSKAMNNIFDYSYICMDLALSPLVPAFALLTLEMLNSTVDRGVTSPGQCCAEPEMFQLFQCLFCFTLLLPLFYLSNRAVQRHSPPT